MGQLSISTERMEELLMLAKTATQAEDLEALKQEISDELGDIGTILKVVTGIE